MHGDSFHWVSYVYTCFDKFDSQGRNDIRRGKLTVLFSCYILIELMSNATWLLQNLIELMSNATLLLQNFDKAFMSQ